MDFSTLLISTHSIFWRFFGCGAGEPGHPQKKFDKFSKCSRKRKRFDMRQRNLVNSSAILFSSLMIFLGFFRREVRERERPKFSKKSMGSQRGDTSRVPLIINYKFLHWILQLIGAWMWHGSPKFHFPNRGDVLYSPKIYPILRRNGLNRTFENSCAQNEKTRNVASLLIYSGVYSPSHPSKRRSECLPPIYGDFLKTAIFSTRAVYISDEKICPAGNFLEKTFHSHNFRVSPGVVGGGENPFPTHDFFFNF